MSGWIKIHRDITENWIWSNSDYLKWWLDILLEVNHTDTKLVIKSKLYECKRGQKLYSLDTWAKRWGTNKSKARRFLTLLENDNMIELKNETQTTRLTVCKYDSYQDERNANETQMKRKRNASETEVKPIQECKERKEGKEEENISFDEFWDLYDKKVGDKDKLKTKWSKIKQEDREKIMKFIPYQKKNQPNKKFRPNPETFLNGKRWNDEFDFGFDEISIAETSLNAKRVGGMLKSKTPF